MKRVFIIANSDGALFRFRNSLIQKLSDAHEVIAVSGASPEADYSSSLENLGATVKRVDFTTFVGKLYTIANFVKLIYRKNCTDVFLVYTLPAILLFGVASRLAPGSCKAIATVTGIGRHFSQADTKLSMKASLILCLCRKFTKCFDHVVFQNIDDLKLFREYVKAPHQEYHLVNGSGVDLKYWEMSCPATSDDDLITFTYLGRGIKEKGLKEFLEAAAYFHKDDNKVFQVAGTIEQKFEAQFGNVTDYCEQFGIKYLGFVKDTKRLLKHTDVVVSPSYYREGVPRSLIEALAMDCYIITCDTTGNREVIIDGFNGLFVEERNVASIISAINKVDKDFIAIHRGRSRRLAEQKFDVIHIDNKVIELLA